MGLILIGGGGFCKEALQYARDAMRSGECPGGVKGFLAPEITAPELKDKIDYLGCEDDYVFTADDLAVVAIGEPNVRRSIAEKLEARGVNFTTIIQPTAYVAPSSVIEPGCIIAPFAFVAPDSTVGAHSILNIYASVGHDAVIGRYCTFGPYATVNGEVMLDEQVFLGTHAGVTPGCRIGRMCKVAAGSIASADAGEGVLLLGNPAKGRVMFR